MSNNPLSLSASPGPNPWKAVFLFEELGLNYEIKSIRFDDVKKKPFIDVNPNGRVPAIEDPNTGLILWESGAIYQYGQCGWFQHLHSEKVPSAVERYSNEIKRVLAIMEGILAAKPANSQWLVGQKMTFADMAWLPWNFRLSETLLQSWDEVWEGTPHVRAWHERMAELPSWKRCMEIRARIETFTDYEAKIAAGQDTTAKQ
ncbi:glutathione S-transferase [Daldinia decipiens]|uniref:glutathione S-transferase n=1 Tax=Daldinia decipiens TaxID=326647 RepID=UPI0020C23267|nr:glutathione S-transferase [Daldinia decipiens]KAI1653372.1 glutathione S-transferase [Daldinia decipiens]